MLKPYAPELATESYRQARFGEPCRLVAASIVVALICLALGGGVQIAPAAAATPSRDLYTITDLGNLGGKAAFGINESGDVVGMKDNGHGFMFDHATGLLQDLGPGVATAISNTGLVVGFGRGTGAGGKSYGVASRGRIVAGSTPQPGLIDPAFGSSSSYPSVWTATEGWQSLYDSGCRFPRVVSGVATSVNDFGEIVGQALQASPQLEDIVSIAFKCAPSESNEGEYTPVNLILPGGPYAGAFSINNHGQVAGKAHAPDSEIQAYRWDPDEGHKPQPLGLVPDGHSRSESFLNQSVAYGINDAGDIVGTYGPVATFPLQEVEVKHNRAFIWHENDGIMRDLNDLLPNGSPWVLNVATAINRHGQIVGQGTLSGQTRAFVLTPTGDVNITADRIMVTQVIQNEENLNLLVAGKKTFAIVRTHTDTRTASGVSAKLYGTRDGVDLGEEWPISGPINVVQHPDVANVSHSFVFAIPWSWTAAPGQLTLHSEVNPDTTVRETNYRDNLIPTTVSFHDPPELKVKVVDIHYSEQPLSKPDKAAYDRLRSYAERAFPISHLGGGYHPTVVDIGPAPPSTTREELKEMCGTVLEDLAKVRLDLKMDDQTILFGQMPSMPDGSLPHGDTAGCASVPGMVATGWTEDPNYGQVAAHELSHAIGRDHVPSCGATGFNLPVYPYPGDSAPIHGGSLHQAAFKLAGDYDLGFDGKGFLPALAAEDLMTYCDTRWMSDYTYENLYREIPLIGTREPGSLEREVVLVVGTVNAIDETADIDITRRLQEDTAQSFVPGPYHIQLFDESGAKLADYPFAPTALERHEIVDADVPRASINTVVPYSEGARRVAIYSDLSTKEIASAAISSNVPSLTITSPAQGAVLPATGSVTFNWTASDPDGDPLTYTVLYKPEGPTSWTALASGLVDTSLSVDAKLLPGATDGVVRVIADDGANTRVADHGGFTVPSKEPTVTIDGPPQGRHSSIDQAVLLEGWADDAQDGPLRESELVWSSDRDGQLGTGTYVVATDLSVGEHTITLLATNSAGQSTSASTRIAIVNSDQPGPTLGVSHTELAFSYDSDSDALGQPLSIDNLGSGDLSWTASSDDPRVTLDPDSGSEPATTQVSLNTAGLKSGDSFSAHVTISAPGAADSPKVVTVTAESTEPIAGLSRYEIHFDRQRTQTASVPRPIELTYNGVEELDLADVSLAGGAPDDFVLSGDSCSEVMIPSGSTCTVSVSFQPTRTGERTAYVVFSDRDSPARWYVALSGQGAELKTVTNGVAAWGLNANGQIGVTGSDPCRTGQQLCEPVPVEIGALSDVTSVAVGHQHSLAVKANGTLWAWGLNSTGQLGNGTTSSTANATPQQVQGLDNVSAIAGSHNHSLAVKEDGTVWAWGSDFDGQIGDGEYSFVPPRTRPVQVKGLNGAGNLTDVVAVATGMSATGQGSHIISSALKTDGTVWAWGTNFAGETGSGSFGDPNPTPVQVVGPDGSGSLSEVTDIAYSMALKSDGTIWTWGNGFHGELGTGQNTRSAVPVQVVDASGEPLNGVVDIASFLQQRYALTSDGHILAWGNFGQPGGNGGVDLGIGSQFPNGTAVPRPVLGPDGATPLSNVVSVQPGLALKSDGTIWAWGSNLWGGLGRDRFADDSGVALQVTRLGDDGTLARVSAIAASGHRLILHDIVGAGRLIAGPSVSVNGVEGNPLPAALGTFSDTDATASATELSASIDWGDGSPKSTGSVSGSTGGPFTVHGEHAYAQPTTYTVEVDVTDREGNTALLHATAAVADAPLVALDPVVLKATEGSPLSQVVGSFKDTNPTTPESAFSAQVNWGDGSPTSTGTVTGPPGGPFTISAAHTYAEQGEYSTRVAVTDEDGSAVSVAGAAIVAPAALTAGASFTTISTQGGAFSGPVALFNDAKPGSSAADFTAAIKWGDGSSSAGTVTGPSGGPYTVAGSHLYSTLGPSTVTVTLIDRGGRTATATTALMNRHPHITLTESSDPAKGNIPFVTTFTYEVTNDGTDPIFDVAVTGSECGQASYQTGDNGNGLLDPGERWAFSCRHTFTTAGTFTDVASGTGTGLIDGFPLLPEMATAVVEANERPAWPFEGFFSPVDNPPVVNKLNAGSTVPVKFGLGGNHGMDIFATGFPASANVSCTGGPIDSLEEITTPGASELMYNAATLRYQFNWKTQKPWNGTCRQLVLRFVDGSERTAQFRFK